MDVLLVEDDPEMRMFLQAEQESRGHTVTMHADGKRKWKPIQSRHFSMVTLKAGKIPLKDEEGNLIDVLGTLPGHHRAQACGYRNV